MDQIWVSAAQRAALRWQQGGGWDVLLSFVFLTDFSLG